MAALAGAILSALWAHDVHACSGLACGEPEFFPARGTVPANLPAVLYWPVDDEFGDASPPLYGLRFVRLTATSYEDVPFRVEQGTEASPRFGAGGGEPALRVIPEVPLQAGSRYALWSETCFDAQPSEPPRTPSPLQASGSSRQTPLAAPYAVFDVVEATPLPTALGPVTLTRPRLGPLTFGGGPMCARELAAVAVDATVQTDLGVWSDAVAFRTVVDGEVYRPVEQDFLAPAYGYSWTGRGQDTLAAICAQGFSGPLAEGAHQLRFEASVAGSDQVLSTETVQFTLSCDVADDGSGCSSVGSPAGSPPTSVWVLGIILLAGRVMARRARPV